MRVCVCVCVCVWWWWYVLETAGITPLHKPQLFFAVQAQCGVSFRDDVVYDFGIPAPFSDACLLPFRPRVSSMRRREVETSVLAESAEELFRQGQLDMSLQAYNLRLALLQCLLEGTSHEAATALLDSAAVFITMVRGGLLWAVVGESSVSLRVVKSCNALELTPLPMLLCCVPVLVVVLTKQRPQGRASQALQCVGKALQLLPRNHALSARGLMLRMKGLFLSGEVEEAVASYEAAQRAAAWHLGELHPVLPEMGVEVARELTKEGRLEEAAMHLNE